MRPVAWPPGAVVKIVGNIIGVSVVSKVVRIVDYMSLPFLPLCPTGTNPPTPAAAAAMDEALGMPEREVVRNILANLRAGDEEGAKEWATLVRNVFPNAPTPTHAPISNKAWFYEMCQRYRDLREFREMPIAQPLAAFKAAQEASWEQYRRLQAIPRNNPIRERRKNAWKRAKLRAFTLWKALPLVGRARTARLRFLEQRLTEWEPSYHSIYLEEQVDMDALDEAVDNGEFSQRFGGLHPEYNTPEDDPLFYSEYNGNPPWLPQSS